MEIQLWLLIIINLFAKIEEKIETIFASSMAINTTQCKLSIITQLT